MWSCLAHKVYLSIVKNGVSKVDLVINEAVLFTFGLCYTYSLYSVMSVCIEYLCCPVVGLLINLTEGIYTCTCTHVLHVHCTFYFMLVVGNIKIRMYYVATILLPYKVSALRCRDKK